MSPDIFMRLLVVLMRPIAEFCVRHGLSIQDMLEAGKATLIAASEKELQNRGEKVTMSQLGVMTGVHRRDIYRISRHKQINTGSTALASRVLGNWCDLKKYQTSAGLPRSLTVGFEDCEFNQLVRTVTTEMHPANILMVLERLKLIEIRSGKAYLLTDAMATEEGPTESFEFLATDIGDIVTAVEENVLGKPEIRNLHVTTEYTKIPSRFLPQIRRWILSEGSAFHRRARDFLSQYDLDVNPELDSKGIPVRIAVVSCSRVEQQITGHSGSESTTKGEKIEDVGALRKTRRRVSKE